MGQQRAVESDLADRVVPDEYEPDPPGLEHAQRDQAERVIEQMRDDIEEEDVARPQADPSGHGVISGAATPPRPAGRSRRARPPPRRAAAAGPDGWRWRGRCRPCRGPPSSSAGP